MPDPAKNYRFALISLGCPKNLVDTERMAGLLTAEGYRHVFRAEDADFVVINTCGFIGDAREESHRAIEEMLLRKARGELRGVIVAGCLAERDKELLLSRHPQIDQLVGVFGREEIGLATRRIMEKHNAVCGMRYVENSTFRIPHSTPPTGAEDNPARSFFPPPPSTLPTDTPRLRLTPRHLAYLRIAEGCSRSCSFCSIPRIRGPYASKTLEQVVSEARDLAADGVRELIVVAQDTTFYGIDLYGKPRLAELLRRLDAVEGLRWIRLLYLYPMHITDELIETLATAEKILPYLDLPLQHIHDEVLRRMRRCVSRAETEALLEKLRRRIKSLVLRTTWIAGFPGETEEQFQELLTFVKMQRFERFGVFAYSCEPDTPAAELEGALPEELKRSRREQLLAAQQPIAFAWNASRVGTVCETVIDRSVPGGKNAYVGRSFADAPEIDGVVYVTGEGLQPGQIVPCEIVAARGYDLIGVAVEREVVNVEVRESSEPGRPRPRH
jgi:ribosomal protein S12 methylthiotransferase